MFKALLNSAKKSWRGEEKLWKVFWLWGVCIEVLAIPIGFLTVGLWNTCPNLVTYIFAITIMFAGLVFVFIYPIIFSISLWRCAKNVETIQYRTLARAYIPVFLLLHLPIGILVLLGSGYLKIISIDGDRLGSIAGDGCFSYFYK